MKPVIFSIALFIYFLSFSNSAFGQMKKTEKPIVSYNREIGDWDVVVPLNSSFIFHDNLVVFIYVNGGFYTDAIPAEVTERGVEIIHPSELFLNEGNEYDFHAKFFYRNYPLPVYITKSFTFFAPKLNLNLRWEAVNYYLKAKITISLKNFDDFNINHEESYFYTKDVLADSIIYGSQKIFSATYRNNEFNGEKFININEIAIDKQFVGFCLRLDNDDGQEKLRAFALSAFLVEGFFVIEHNLTGRGAVTPYMFDNKPRESEIFSSMGAKIEDVILQSDEPYWLPEGAPSGKYFLRIRGFPTGEIIKINF